MPGLLASEMVVGQSDLYRGGAGEPGPITKKIQEIFFACGKGEVDEYSSWNKCV